MIGRKHLERKVSVSGKLVFATAFHIGSGREGELGTNMGVLKDPGSGAPVLPGSGLKGKFRASAERLASHFQISACLLDMALSGEKCVTDESYRRDVFEEFKDLSDEQAKLEWLGNHVCEICQLFGSPFHAARIYFSDGMLEEWSGTTEIRDGVSLDRDSGTARPGMKFDLEVIPSGAGFKILIDLENPTDMELALTGAVLAEWEQGVRIGGNTSRGLGLAHLKDIQVKEVNFSDREQCIAYLMHRRMSEANGLLNNKLANFLQTQGGTNA